MSYWDNKDPNDFYIIAIAVFLIAIMIYAQYG